MVPETELELRERKMQEALCGLVGHEFMLIEMPKDWKHLSSSVRCKYCTYSAPIEVTLTN